MNIKLLSKVEDRPSTRFESSLSLKCENTYRYWKYCTIRMLDITKRQLTMEYGTLGHTPKHWRPIFSPGLIVVVAIIRQQFCERDEVKISIDVTFVRIWEQNWERVSSIFLSASPLEQIWINRYYTSLIIPVILYPIISLWIIMCKYSYMKKRRYCQGFVISPVPFLYDTFMSSHILRENCLMTAWWDSIKYSKQTELNYSKFFFKEISKKRTLYFCVWIWFAQRQVFFLNNASNFIMPNTQMLKEF